MLFAEKHFVLITKLEGVQSDDKASWEHGGLTRWGLVQADCDTFQPGLKIQDVTPEIAFQMLNKLYWRVAGCDDLPEPLDFVLFQFALHQNCLLAKKHLQRAMGVSDTGVFDAEFVGKVRSQPPEMASLRLILTQIRHYTTTYPYSEVLRSFINRATDTAVLCNLLLEVAK